MSRKQKRQLELKGTIHRCHSCGRELKSKLSIQRGRGKLCYNRHRVFHADQQYMADLRGLAARENG